MDGAFVQRSEQSVVHHGTGVSTTRRRSITAPPFFFYGFTANVCGPAA